MNQPTTTHPRSHDIAKPRKIDVRQDCTRCGGAGGWTGWPGFTCFKCAGVGRNPVDLKVWQFPAEWTDTQVDEFLAAKEAKSAATRQRRLDKQVADQQARIAPFAAAHPELWAALDAADGGFLCSIADSVRKFGELTDKQFAAAEKAVTQQAERTAEKAEAADAPTGRTQVEGEVVATKWTDGRFPAFKMMVKADTGYRVWVTVPSQLDTPERGDRVRFTATLTQSDDDPTFAFGSRPAGAELVGETVEVEESVHSSLVRVGNEIAWTELNDDNAPLKPNRAAGRGRVRDLHQGAWGGPIATLTTNEIVYLLADEMVTIITTKSKAG